MTLSEYNLDIERLRDQQDPPDEEGGLSWGDVDADEYARQLEEEARYAEEARRLGYIK